MVRLSPEKRNDLLDKAVKVYMDAAEVSDIADVSENKAEMTLEEVFLRKYRVIKCVKLLQEFGLADRFRELTFFDVFDPEFIHLMRANQMSRDDDYVELYEYMHSDVAEPIERYNDWFLSCSLIDTKWEIKYACDMDDYLAMEEPLRRHMKETMEYHWFAIDCQECGPVTEDGEQMQYPELEALGYHPDGDDMYYPNYNLILTNKNVSRMLEICKEDETFKQWEEYKELCKIRKFWLLDRAFIGFNQADLQKDEFIALYYLCGEIYSDKQEEVGMHQLCYEATIFLLLADMLAMDFLAKHDGLSERSVA